MQKLYRRFKKNTPLRRFAGPALVRSAKRLEQLGGRLGRGFTRVEHRCRYRAICHIGVQKTGTVWFREMFSDLRMYRYTGLPFVNCAGSGTDIDIVRGIYSPIRDINAALLERAVRDDVAVVGVVRDPVAIVLSWINSTEHYHIKGRNDQGMGERRQALAARDLPGKIDYAVSFFDETDRFGLIEMMLEAGAASGHVMAVRYEDCVYKPDETFRDLFSFCDIGMPEAERRRFTEDHSFAAYSGRQIDSSTTSTVSSLRGGTSRAARELPEELRARILQAAQPRLRALYT